MINFETISPKELDMYIYKKNVFIIDLRPKDEYEDCHIKGAANIPYARLGECGILSKDIDIILYCERGSKSLVAAKELSSKGYRVKSVIGGIHSYRGQNLEYGNKKE